jgi:hypothetical protein
VLANHVFKAVALPVAAVDMHETGYVRVRGRIEIPSGTHFRSVGDVEMRGMGERGATEAAFQRATCCALVRGRIVVGPSRSARATVAQSGIVTARLATKAAPRSALS